VINALDYGIDGVEYIVLEDFGAASFGRYLQERGPLKRNVDDFLDAAIQIVDALGTYSIKLRN
jgi:hypothetical protein